MAARKYGLGYVVHAAEWRKNGGAAGFIRNRTIVDCSDEVHAWHDGFSRGTKHTIRLARSAGKLRAVNQI